MLPKRNKNRKQACFLPEIWNKSSKGVKLRSVAKHEK